MKKTKKALASLAIAGMALSLVPFNAFAAGTVPTRLAGTTAEQTAVKIADQTGWTGTAILASSASYGMVDALTSGPLAKFLKAPILLQGAGAALNADTKQELVKLAVKKVYVTSGTAVISAGVIAELKGMGIEVVSLGGNDRFDTSVNIAKEMVKLGASVSKVAVAYGWLNQDALSIASIASAAGQPILLTEKDSVPASVKAFLTSNITSSDVIGGTGVISETVKAQFPGATRHFGMTAYDTNNQVIQDFAAALNFDNVFVANGVTAIDALAGAPLAADTKSAIVLTDGMTVPAVAAFTYSKAPVSAVTTALGGEFVVPESVRVGVSMGQVTPDSNVLKIVSVSALDAANSVLELVFSKPLTKLETSDVAIQNANTMARFGVKSVSLSSNGLIATVELYAPTDATAAAPVLDYLTNYTVTVNANGTPVKITFNRPMYQKARITDVNAVKRQIVVNGQTINVPASFNFDFQASLGAKVRVWYNIDKDLVNVAFETESPVTGKLEVTKTRVVGTENGKVELDGVEYNLGDTLVFDHNDTLGGVIGIDGTEYAYAKVFFDKNGAIERVVSYDWDSFFVVKSTEDGVAISYDNDELDLSDYIIIKDGKSIAVSDMVKGDVVYFEDSSNGGDGVAQVYNKKVTGAIETVYQNKIKIGGTNYTFLGGAYGAAQYLDTDTFTNLDADKAEEFQAGGSVTAYLDSFGYVVYIEGSEGTVDSNTKSAYNVEGFVAYLNNGLADRGTFDIEAVNGAGDSVVKSFRVSTLDKVTVTDNTVGTKDTYEVGKLDPNVATKIEEFRLVLNIAGDYDLVTVDNSAVPVVLSVVRTITVANTNDLVMDVNTDDNGLVQGLEFFTGDAQTAATLALDDSYVSTVGGGKYRLQSDTVVYNTASAWDAVAGVSKPDASDITVTTWGKIASAGYDILDSQVYPDKDGNVKYLVINNTDASDKTDTNAVITSVLKNKDGDVVEIKALVAGVVKTYAVDELGVALAKGQSVVLSVNDGSQLVEAIAVAPGTLVTGTVTAINLANKEITVGGNVYKLISNGKVYDATDIDDITVATFRDIVAQDLVVVPAVVGDTVDILLDEAGTFFAMDISIK